MRKRTKGSTRRKAEIAAAMNLINEFVASKIELPNTIIRDDVFDELVDPKNAARMLGVSTKTLANWRTSGVMPLPFVKIGSRVKYRSSDLQVYLLNQSHRSTSEYSSTVLASYKAVVR